MPGGCAAKCGVARFRMLPGRSLMGCGWDSKLWRMETGEWRPDEQVGMSEPDRDPAGCFGALALELRPGDAPGRLAFGRLALGQQPAGELAALIAADLGRLVPEAAGLDLCLAAASFDSVELLRPGWPLHRELQRLVARAPVGDPDAPARVIAFGTHGDAMPPALAPDPSFADGAFRLLPFVLQGAPQAMAEVGERLEHVLLDAGMAGAATALCAQSAFGVAIEHARYLTVHDLAAMMAMQYDHAGLASAWPLVESALLAPDAIAWLDAPPEPLVRVQRGQAQVALLDESAWRTGGWAPAGVDDPVRLARGFDRFQMRQRQLAALLEAHGIAVSYAHCPGGKDPRAWLDLGSGHADSAN